MQGRAVVTKTATITNMWLLQVLEMQLVGTDMGSKYKVYT